jgi:hypothetical protein
LGLGSKEKKMVKNKYQELMKKRPDIPEKEIIKYSILKEIIIPKLKGGYVNEKKI